VVPVKDTEPELLVRAVCSALQQDYEGDIEVVVFDDGSSKDRHRVNATFLAALPRPAGRTLRTGRRSENRGISTTRNDAVRIASSNWLVWLDSDDELPADAVQLLVDAVVADDRVRLVAGQCRVVFPGGRRVHRNDGFLKNWRELRGSRYDPALSTVFAVHGSLVRRDLFQQVHGFDPTMPYGELTDWFLRVLAVSKSEEVAVVKATTYVYYKRLASHSADREQLERHRQRALSRYAEATGMTFQPTFEVGDHCGEYGARRYSLLDEEGRMISDASLRFTSLLVDTVPHSMHDDGASTVPLAVSPPAATSAPSRPAAAAHPEPGARHRVADAGTGPPSAAGSGRHGGAAAG
jgi:glycosyltransferase involved in cell wall biosynthesis